MTHSRRIWALPALTLALVLGACSTPEDLTTPVLEPQYGTAYTDSPVGVVTGPAGAVYNLYNYVSPADCIYYDDGYYDCYDHEDVGVLTRYDAAGGVVWERNVFNEYCYDEYYCNIYRAEAVFVDANNYTYVLVSDYYPDEPDGPGPDVNFTVHKYAPLGEEIGSYTLDYFSVHRPEVAYKLAVDAAGNMYVAAQGDSYEGNNYLAKYTSTGSLVWGRSSTIAPAYGTPTDIKVSSSGSIYVVGTKGFSRHTSTGDVTWSKTGNFSEVILSGSSLYTRYGTAVYKYDSKGTQLWKKTQAGLTSLALASMSGDSSGNVYLAGKYSASSTNRNAFTRKLNSSGTVLWTQTYGTSVYDDALDISTINGSEIYTAGVTNGALSHPSRGGGDGYLRKTNSSGTRVWTR